MTYKEERQLIKNTALNAITKIFHPLYDRGRIHLGDFWDDEDSESNKEYDYNTIEGIISEMNNKLQAAKNKFKKEQIKQSCNTKKLQS